MVYEEYVGLNQHIGRVEREILAVVVYIYYFKKPSVLLFPTINDRADRNSRLTPPSPLPCHA
jgi:hypothetical protein